MMTIF
jgi:hypothetical protein